MTGKPSSPVRREAVRKRTRPRPAPRRAAHPSGWLMRSRRLVRDFEALPASSEAFIHFSATMLMARRLARTAPGTRPVSPSRQARTTLAA
jgi:hypothetical protein